MKKITNMKELVEDAHDRAKRKGWWDGETRPENEVFWEKAALIHSEISEALECYRNGEMDTVYDTDSKPTGFWTEIADVVIRCADWAGWANATLELKPLCPYSEPVPWVIFALHASVTSAERDGFEDLISHCFDMAEAHGVDLWEEINTKSAYNETRPKRHGGKKC